MGEKTPTWWAERYANRKEKHPCVKCGIPLMVLILEKEGGK